MQEDTYGLQNVPKTNILYREEGGDPRTTTRENLDPPPKNARNPI